MTTIDQDQQRTDTALRPYSGGEDGGREFIIEALIRSGMTEHGANLSLDSYAAGVIVMHVTKGGCEAMVKEDPCPISPKR